MCVADFLCPYDKVCHSKLVLAKYTLNLVLVCGEFKRCLQQVMDPGNTRVWTQDWQIVAS